MDRYGCVENTHLLPKKFLPFLNQLQLSKMYVVPSKGWRTLTGSGTAGFCHDNAIRLCFMFGGKRMVGYEVTCFGLNPPDEEWSFTFHSVWITPEGKMVNPTRNVPTSFYVGFLPLQIQFGEWDEENPYPYWINASEYANRIMVSKNNFETEGIEFMGDKGSRVIPFDETLNTKDFYEYEPPGFYDPSSLRGGFTTPSTATGKTFDEIWMERTGLAA